MRIYNLLTNQGHYSRSGETDYIRFLMEFREIHLPEWEIYLFLRFVKLFLRLEGSERKWINLIKKTSSRRNVTRKGLEVLLPKIIWPEQVSVFSESYHCNFIPIRVYNPEIKKERSHSGEFYSRKMNRNVFYESKLEKHFFKRLEQSDVVRAYCEQPFKVPYEHHGSHYYVPDVLVCLTDGQCFVTEIKPLLMMASKEVMTKYQALHDFCNQRG